MLFSGRVILCYRRCVNMVDMRIEIKPKRRRVVFVFVCVFVCMKCVVRMKVRLRRMN